MLQAGERRQVNALAPAMGQRTGSQGGQSNAVRSMDSQRFGSQRAKGVNGSAGSQYRKNSQTGSMMALGRLPTLGLNKYTENHFRDDTRNPFFVQKDTETMLVVRELEREFKDLNKFEKDALRVNQKGISTRQDRSGAIREVNRIQPRKQRPGLKSLKAIGETDDARESAANKKKFNVFDANDDTVLKQDMLAKLGHDEQALMPVDESQS